MEPRPRLSSVSSYASSSSLSSYYGCASGVSDVELTNDTYGALKSRTLFDDVKVILCRHDRKLSKLEDDLTFMVRWLHEKFGFTLKSESISSIPSGLDEQNLAEDSFVFSEDEDADIEEAASRKGTPISEALSHIDDRRHTSRSQGQPHVTGSECDVEVEQRETLALPSRQDSTSSNSNNADPEPNNALVAPEASASASTGAKSTTPFDLKALAGTSTSTAVVAQAPSTSAIVKESERVNLAPRQTKATNKDGQRSSQCDICGKFLKDACTLRQHKQIHLNVRPFTCSEPGCGKSFRRKFHLQTHSLIHQGVKKHQCGYCGRLFLLQKDMVTHERLHTGEKPFQCPECPKSFNIKSHLTIHLRIHTGEKPYNCEVCKKNFSQANSLRIHKKKVHQPKPNRQQSTSKESRPKQSKKKSSPAAGRKSTSENKTQTTTVTLPQPLPAKLPLYRNQGKILNYFVNTVPSISTPSTLSPSITILQQQQPIPSSSRRIEIIEPILGGNSESGQIFVPASTLNLVPTSGASIITAAEILDSSSQISLTRNIIL